MTSERRWSRVVVRLGGVIALAMLVACSAPAPPTAGSTAGGATGQPTTVANTTGPTGAGQPQRGGTFVFAVPGKFANCNTYDVNDRPTNMTLDHVYETLVRYDYNQKDFRENFDVVPWLAESWDNPDPSTYVFHLRNAQWHDGTPFTADDVVATYALLKKNNYAAYSTWRGFQSVEAVDPHIVKFTLTQPVPKWQVMANLGEPSNAQIMPKHIIDAGKLDTACIGTGPFKVQNIEANSKATMVRNENYWQKDKNGQQQSYLDGVELIYGMDRSAMQGAFAAGKLDLTPLTTWPEVQAFTAQVLKAQVYEWPAHWSHGFVVNFGKFPFNDKNMRQAMNLLLDRQQAIDTVYYGKGVVSLPVSPAVREGWGLPESDIQNLPGYRADKEADIAEGKRLLADAGYGPGKNTLTIDLLYTSSWAVAPLADAVAGQLKPYNIDVQLHGEDSATFSKDRRDGKYDMALWHTASPDPLLRPQQNWYTKSPDAQGAKMPDLGQDKIFDELRSTAEEPKQKELVLQLQKLALDEVFAFAMADPETFAVVQPWVHGYQSSRSVQAEITGSANQLWLDTSALPAERKSS